MNTHEIAETLSTLLAELVDGAPKQGGYMLNPGDDGLVRSLERLSASQASFPTRTGSTIAAHVDHVRYGLSLMNRWSRGENPFGSADWSESWRRTTVSDEEWKQRLAELREETASWIAVVQTPRDLNVIELNGMIGSIAHLAYHLGAIRQIDQSTRGPAEGGGDEK